MLFVEHFIFVARLVLRVIFGVGGLFGFLALCRLFGFLRGRFFFFRLIKFFNFGVLFFKMLVDGLFAEWRFRRGFLGAGKVLRYFRFLA